MHYSFRYLLSAVIACSPLHGAAAAAAFKNLVQQRPGQVAAGLATAGVLGCAVFKTYHGIQEGHQAHKAVFGAQGLIAHTYALKEQVGDRPAGESRTLEERMQLCLRELVNTRSGAAPARPAAAAAPLAAVGKQEAAENARLAAFEARLTALESTARTHRDGLQALVTAVGTRNEQDAEQSTGLHGKVAALEALCTRMHAALDDIASKHEQYVEKLAKEVEAQAAAALFAEGSQLNQLLDKRFTEHWGEIQRMQRKGKQQVWRGVDAAVRGQDSKIASLRRKIPPTAAARRRSNSEDNAADVEEVSLPSSPRQATPAGGSGGEEKKRA
jgi:ribosome-associated translation inhibitor RaiA